MPPFTPPSTPPPSTSAGQRKPFNSPSPANAPTTTSVEPCSLNGGCVPLTPKSAADLALMLSEPDEGMDNFLLDVILDGTKDGTAKEGTAQEGTKEGTAQKGTKEGTAQKGTAQKGTKEGTKEGTAQKGTAQKGTNDGTKVGTKVGTAQNGCPMSNEAFDSTCDAVVIEEDPFSSARKKLKRKANDGWNRPSKKQVTDALDRLKQLQARVARIGAKKTKKAGNRVHAVQRV